MKFIEWIARKDIQKIADKENLNIKKLDINQIIDGYKVELEHGLSNPKTNVTNNDMTKTLKITLAHLYEDPNYYKKLKTIHKEDR